MKMWALLLALLVTTVTGAEALCQRLFVKGLDPAEFPFAASHEGTYSLYQGQAEDQSTLLYVHETQPLILEVYSDDFLVFRPLNDSLLPRLSVRIKQGYDAVSWLKMVEKTKHPFRRIVDGWIYMDDMDTIHFLSGNMDLQCASDEMHQCSANTFLFSHAISRKVAGEITMEIDDFTDFTQIQGLYYNQRPVFRSDVDDHLLFFDSEYWVVAVTFTARPIVRSKDLAFRPEYISSFWQVRHESGEHHEWKVRRHLRLLCTLSIQDVLGELVSCSEKSNPCENHGDCYIVEHGRERDNMYCLCPPGYTGVLCQRSVQKCPAPEPASTNGKISSTAGTDQQYLGSIVLKYCSAVKAFSSICALDQFGRAIWLDNGACHPKTTSTSTSIPLSSTEQSSTAATTEEEATSTQATTSSTFFPFNLSEKVNTSQQDAQVYDFQNASDSSKEMKTSEQKSGFKKEYLIMACVIVLETVLALVLIFTAKALMKKQGRVFEQVTEKHVESMQALHDERDRSMQKLAAQHPGLLYSIEAGVFTQDSPRYTEDEKKAIAQEYCRQYNEFETRIEAAEEHNQKELTQMKRLRISSMTLVARYCYCLLVLWLAYFLACNMLDQCVEELNSTGFISCAICYIFILLESFTSYELYCMHKMNRFGNVENYMAYLKQQQPTIVMCVDTIRVDLNTAVDLHKDAEGILLPKVHTHPQKVVTSKQVTYDYTSWRDTSDGINLSRQGGITKIKMSKEIIHLDPQDFKRARQQAESVSDRYRNAFAQFSVIEHVDGFEDFVVVYDKQTPCWLKSRVLFVFSSFLFCSWIFRLVFRRYLTETKFKLSKTVYSSSCHVDSAIDYDQEKARKDTTKAVANLHEKLKRSSQWKSNPIFRSTESL